MRVVLIHSQKVPTVRHTTLLNTDRVKLTFSFAMIGLNLKVFFSDVISAAKGKMLKSQTPLDTVISVRQYLLVPLT